MIIQQPRYAAGTVLVSIMLTAEMVNAERASPTSIQVTIAASPRNEIHLEARQAPLGQILKEIAEKTGVTIHYSVLPNEPVTATCAGANAGQIMDCLVAKQIGLIAHKPQKDKPAEFWLLGSSVGSCQAVTVVPNSSPVTEAAGLKYNPTPEEQAQADQSMQEQSDRLLEQIKSKDPNQRAEAIGNLISAGVKDDPNVRKVLEEALADKDGNVRAQALTALAQRGGEGASEALRQALHDTDTSVRLAAVNNAGNDTVLLQQAMADKDPMIRDYAASKLEALNAKGKGN